MSAYLLKAKFSDEQFRTIAGLRTVSEEINGEPIVKRELGKKHPTLLGGVSGHHAICGQGVFVGTDAEQATKRVALEGAILAFELSFESGERIRADYLITKLEYAGDFNGERQYKIALMSSGKVEVL